MTSFTKNNLQTRPKNRLICQSPMVDFQYKENQERFLIKERSYQMMTYSINVNELLWCDKCTNEVVSIDGEEQGPICPTCQTGFYLETL
jgi:hypothetical protein